MINRIKEIASEGYKFLLYDNSNNEIVDFNNFNNICYVHSKMNKGLSGAIYYNLKKAHDEDYFAVLNFDQDTFFTKRTLIFIEIVINNYLTKEKLGTNLISLTFRDFKSKKKSNDIIISEKIYKYSEVNFTINSGTLYILKHFNKFNWFNQKYFVDGVDYYFCIQSNKFHFKNFEIYDTPDLNHIIEQDDDNFKFLFFNIRGRKYSLKRNKDFIKSHLNLLHQTLINLQSSHFIFIFKSLILYFTTQLIFYFKKAKAK
jgi:rhamnosyltransferase